MYIYIYKYTVYYTYIYVYTYLWSLGELSWVVALKLSYHWMARTNNHQNGMIEYWLWNGQLWSKRPVIFGDFLCLGM